MTGPVLTTIVAALVAGATAKAKDVASEAVGDAYHALKALVLRRIGKDTAVHSIEQNPDSETARKELVTTLAASNLQADREIVQLAQKLEDALGQSHAPGTSGPGDIDVGSVHGQVNALVENLVATGSIRIGSVVANTGDAVLRGVGAGFPSKNG
jgi:hypothetical protein